MASLFPILIPIGNENLGSVLCIWYYFLLSNIGHILVLWHFWADYSRKVERGNCTCDCWDTVFKGINNLFDRIAFRKPLISFLLFIVIRHIRIRRSTIQTLIFQCNRERNENMGTYRGCDHCAVWMHKTLNQTDVCQICSLLDGVPILLKHFSPLLCMVGRC